MKTHLDPNQDDPKQDRYGVPYIAGNRAERRRLLKKMTKAARHYTQNVQPHEKAN